MMEAATATAGDAPPEQPGRLGAFARLARGELGSLRVLIAIA